MQKKKIIFSKRQYYFVHPYIHQSIWYLSHYIYSLPMSTHLNAHCWVSFFLRVTMVFRQRLQWNARFKGKADNTAVFSQTCVTKQWTSLSFHSRKLDIAISRAVCVHTGLFINHYWHEKTKIIQQEVLFSNTLEFCREWVDCCLCCNNTARSWKRNSQLISSISEYPGNLLTVHCADGELDSGRCESVEWIHFYVFKLKI